MPLTAADIPAILVGIQGVFLVLLFLGSPYFRSRANSYLALTFGTLAIISIIEFHHLTALPAAWKTLHNDIMWEYLFAPSLFLYFAAVLKHPFAERPVRWWLFLPFLLTLVVNVIIDLDHEFGSYDLGLAPDNAMLNLYYEIETWSTILFALVLCRWSYLLIKRNPSPIPSNWIPSFWRLSTMVIIAWGISQLLMSVTGLDLFYWLWVSLALLFGWITYRGVLQFKLAEERFEIRSRFEQLSNSATAPLPSAPLTTSKRLGPAEVQIPQDASLTASKQRDANSEIYFNQLESLMRTEKIYRDANLSREQVAERLGISSGYLSRLLSKHQIDNFSNYINRFRVSEVQLLLEEGDFQHYSLLSIGFEAGFNSKSTFYTAFKKISGQTPSAYRSAIRAKN